MVASCGCHHAWSRYLTAARPLEPNWYEKGQYVYMLFRCIRILGPDAWECWHFQNNQLTAPHRQVLHTDMIYSWCCSCTLHTSMYLGLLGFQVHVLCLHAARFQQQKAMVLRCNDEIFLMPLSGNSGDRCLIKLINFVFHQCNEAASGGALLDRGHVVSALNKLNLNEKIMLLSRDEMSMLLVSYADVKQCINITFNELEMRASQRHDGLWLVLCSSLHNLTMMHNVQAMQCSIAYD